MSAAVGWQRIEGALVFGAVLALWLSEDQHVTWWAALLLFFAPDLSFLAYLRGARVGALAYNAVHIYGFGVAAMALGVVTGLPFLSAAGLLWLGHSGFDRMLGYGLKLPEGFQETHLGRIGRRTDG